MRIKDLPEQNRPRERFLKYGPESLSDAELFAIFLRTGSKDNNVIDMSNKLIKEYGLINLFDCSLKELEKIKGIGPSKAMQILTIKEMAKRISLSKNSVRKISSAQDVVNLYQERLKNEKQEHFIILMLNNQNNIIDEQEVSKGVLDMTIVDSREVFRFAIKNSAAKIILIHNHPGGSPTPSNEDIITFNKLKEVEKIIGIRIVDNIIICGDTYWSWIEENNRG